ncbi:MAG: hypothetical protein AB7U82_14230 [Blastocatellales bacterium]
MCTAAEAIFFQRSALRVLLVRLTSIASIRWHHRVRDGLGLRFWKEVGEFISA